MTKIWFTLKMIIYNLTKKNKMKKLILTYDESTAKFSVEGNMAHVFQLGMIEYAKGVILKGIGEPINASFPTSSDVPVGEIKEGK